MKVSVAGATDDKGQPRRRLKEVWSGNEDRFKARMEEGYYWQVWLAIRLIQVGLVVQIPQEPIWLNRHEDRKIIKDDFDLVVGLQRRVWLEIKAKDYDISRFKDGLYGVERTSWEQLEEKPLAVVVISKRTEEVLVIPTSSEPHWILESKVMDKMRNQVIDVYKCPIKHLKSWNSLVETLKVRTDRGYDNVV